MSGTPYLMWSFRSDQFPEAEDWTRLSNKTLQLVNACQSTVGQDEHILFLPSHDPKSAMIKEFQKIEIAVFFEQKLIQDASTFNFEFFETTLNTEAQKLNLGYGNFHVLVGSIGKSFSDQEVDRIFKAAKSPADWVLNKRPITTAEIPAGKAHSPLHLERSRVSRLKGCKGSELVREMNELITELKAVSVSTTAWATVCLIAGGIVLWYGRALSIKAAVEFVSGLVALALFAMENLIIQVSASAILGLMAEGFAIAGAIAAILAIIVVIAKDANNIMFLINDTDDTISFQNDEIKRGEMKTCTPVVERRLIRENNNNDYVNVGIYIYTKYTIVRQPASFLGSCFGISFGLGNTRKCFSVGMDCPNVAPFRNSISLIMGNQAGVAANIASDGHDEEIEKDFFDTKYKIMVRRALSAGTTNWGICIVK